MRFAIANTFAKSMARLDGPARAAVKRAAFDLQIQLDNPALRLHRLRRAPDGGFWSLRVNRDLRIIVHRAEGEVMLCYAAHHHDAYAWAEQRRMVLHQDRPAAELIQVTERASEPRGRARTEPLPAAPAPASSTLGAGVLACRGERGAGDACDCGAAPPHRSMRARGPAQAPSQPPRCCSSCGWPRASARLGRGRRPRIRRPRPAASPR